MKNYLEYNDFSQEMKLITDKYEAIHLNSGLNYQDLENFLKEAKTAGYQFDYGLDAEPYEFKHIYPVMYKGYLIRVENKRLAAEDLARGHKLRPIYKSFKILKATIDLIKTTY
jgi:uncharacterized protein YueI